MLNKKIVIIKKSKLLNENIVKSNIENLPLSTKLFFKIEIITKFCFFFFGIYRNFLEFKNVLLISKMHYVLNLFFFSLEYFYYIIRIEEFLNFPMYDFLEKKNNNIGNKRYIQKGYKLKKIGVYIRSFLKNDTEFNEVSFNDVSKSWLILVLLKKKNLFLTLLNPQGNVVCKSNLGSCGFKKKNKFTGHSIKRTSRRFSKKILGAFGRTVYAVHKDCKKHMSKIRNLIKFKEKLDFFKYVLNSDKPYKKKVLKKKKKTNTFLMYFDFSHNLLYNQLNNKEVLRKKIVKNNISSKFLEYRKYLHYSKAIQKAFKINIRFKNTFKFWGVRYVIYGLSRRFRWFTGLEFCIPLPHSRGLRLKKRRRV